jgi:hypothetical protein
MWAPVAAGAEEARPAKLRDETRLLKAPKGMHLRIPSVGTQPLCAIFMSQGVRSISQVACASGLMLIMQPRSRVV